MKRKVAIFERVRDVEGGLWEVREVRETKHGFDLLYGVPVRRHAYLGGLARIIATRPLVDFWEENRLKREGVVYDLPAGRTTLKRLRNKLGFCYLNDRTAFWEERIEDLEDLSAREFADRHNVDIRIVFETRRKLFGPVSRLPGWWKKPRAMKVLKSDITLREIGEKLGISITHAKRLRDRALTLRTAKK